MIKDPRFDDIRPYYDEEIPEAMARIAKCGFFALLADYVFPGTPLEQVKELFSSINNTHDFQHKVMYYVNEQIIKRSCTSFTYDGIENVNSQRQYLYVSNHRDIMLDASLLQNVLVDNGHDTSEITFGANLMSMPVIVDIGKSNKMFKVERAGNNPKDFYYTSLHLSQYIRHAIMEKQQSVWIAQRNGRTKDGIDATDQGIIKMFEMSRPEDRVEALSDLSIVPVTVSYEWEPCDIKKALEMYESRGGVYTKMPGEDVSSILSGISDPKGNVHFHIGKPIAREELLPFDDQVNSKFNASVAKLIDKRICSSYKLWPNNYIAHDLLYGQHTYKSLYTKEQKQKFLERVSLLEKYDTCDYDTLKEIFLGIYANPVNSFLKFSEEIDK